MNSPLPRARRLVIRYKFMASNTLDRSAAVAENRRGLGTPVRRRLLYFSSITEHYSRETG